MNTNSETIQKDNGEMIQKIKLPYQDNMDKLGLNDACIGLYRCNGNTYIGCSRYNECKEHNCSGCKMMDAIFNKLYSYEKILFGNDEIDDKTEIYPAVMK